MEDINPFAVFEKLDKFCFKTLNDAVRIAIEGTHYKVEVEHWLLKLFEAPDAPLQSVLNQYDVDSVKISADLVEKIDRFRKGNEREGAPPFSPHILTLIRQAWNLASLKYSGTAIRSVHLLCALLMDDILAPYTREISKEFGRIDPHSLSKEIPRLEMKASQAREQTAERKSNQIPSGKPTPKALDQFTIDLTQRAEAGEIDPVIGRDKEIRQIIDILTRRRQNNPILTGEAGVGKTAVVEGFANYIAAGEVPPSLHKISLRNLDLGLLQAGAGVRGEFEKRLKSVIDEVKASPKPIVLFIDEAHTLIGAGGAAGQSDAANLLKPSLARGELRTIAATTWAEYKKYFEKDDALARRFQVIKIEEPTETEAIEMMRGLVKTLEKHHQVRIRNDAVVEAVRLSSRYIKGRQLPDKAVSLLDTACARVALSQSTTPPEIEDRRRRLEKIKVQRDLLETEALTADSHYETLSELDRLESQLRDEISDLEKRWDDEKKLVSDFNVLRERIENGFQKQKTYENGAPTSENLDTDKEALSKLKGSLKDLQGENPLVYGEVNAQTVAKVVAAWTGIPVGRMATDEIRSVLNLKEKLKKRVIGQDHALDVIAKIMRVSRAKLTDTRKPIGVFFMVGPSGVGKSETALALAEQLYGDEGHLTVINMSEFKEEHKVSTLMGAPPGYVGYGEGGVLTEAVRRRPYSIILLDEMEKAHPGVQEVFLQVFDKGGMQDSEGRYIDFKNTVIIMTSNAKADAVTHLCEDAELRKDGAKLAEKLEPYLYGVFKPEFLGRVALVPYVPLGDEVLKKIVELNMGRVKKRVEENYRATFSCAPEVIDCISARCRETQIGARIIEHIINRTMLPELATHFLSRMAEEKTFSAIEVSVSDSGEFEYQFS